jgi:hypothetical protein
MNRLFFINLFRFLLLLSAQLLIFNKINLGGYINPMVYPLFILLVPFEVSGKLLLLMSFLMGFGVDIFSGTMGLHAAAATLLGFLRPFSLQFISSNREYEAGVKPGVNDLGYAWFVPYTLFLVSAHHFFFFFIETFSFQGFGLTILRTILSILVSTLFIILINLVFKPSIKRR